MMLKMPRSGRSSLVVQWLRLCTPNAGGPGLIPAQGTRSCLPQLKILYTTKTSAQPKNNLKKKINAQGRGNILHPNTEELFLYPPKGEVDITDPTEARLQVYRAEGQDLQLKRNIKNYFVYGEKPSNNQVKKDQSCNQQKKKLERITQKPLGCQVQGRRSWSDTLCLVIPFYLG